MEIILYETLKRREETNRTLFRHFTLAPKLMPGTTVKTIVCLANSYKRPDGRCVAGREISNQQWAGWVRPVSNRETREILYQEYRYASGQIPQLLDVIDVPIVRAEPLRHQCENHVIDIERSWVKRGVMPWANLRGIIDTPDSLWANNESSNTGINDRITQHEAANVTNSLLLIEPRNLMIVIGTNYFTGKRSYRASFEYGRTSYNLSLTDPIARSVYSAREEGAYPLSNAPICVSLTEPYEHDDKCYKLVAAVITEEPLS